MDEKIIKIRQRIAEIEFLITDKNFLKNDVLENLNNLKKSDNEKIIKLEIVFTQKFDNSPENNPQKQIIREKINNLKKIQAKKQNEIEKEIIDLETEVETFLNESRNLTKEMLKLVD